MLCSRRAVVRIVMFVTKDFIMTHRLAICIILASLAFAAPRLVAASDAFLQVTFNTVDSVEIKDSGDGCAGGCVTIVTVRGIPVGAQNASTGTFNFGPNFDVARRCEKLALIAMSKPGCAASAGT
jgi:hypothetical protein